MGGKISRPRISEDASLKMVKRRCLESLPSAAHERKWTSKRAGRGKDKFTPTATKIPHSPEKAFAVYGGNRSIHGLHWSKWFTWQVSKTNTLAWEYLPLGEETVFLSPSKLQWVKKVNNNCLPYFLVSLDSYRQSVSLSSTDSLPKIKWLKYLTVKQPSVKSMLRGWILHPQIVLFYHFTTKDWLSKK